jgi:hypothetical protein
MYATVTNTIFKSNKISFETRDDDYRYVKATTDIEEDELLLIEHCYYTKDLNFIPNVVKHNPELFNNLYPRTIDWNEDMLKTDEIDDLCTMKCQKNSFGCDGHYAIGLNISRFNHLITPNSSTSYMLIDTDIEVPILVLYIYSNKYINKDEEVTISYGKNYFGEEKEEIYLSSKLNKNYVVRIINQYIKNEIFKIIIINHICIFYGLYLVNDMICPSKRLINYFEKELHIECTFENIIKWIKIKQEDCSILLKNFEIIL